MKNIYRAEESYIGMVKGMCQVRMHQVGIKYSQDGSKMWPSWGKLGPSWGNLGPTWFQVRGKLGPSWAKLSDELIWAEIEPGRAQFRAEVGQQSDQ
eukprot:3041767-Karenia_brevis.AAC.1